MAWIKLVALLLTTQGFQGLFHPKMVTRDQCVGWSVEHRLLACLVGQEKGEEFERGVAIVEVDGRKRRVRFYSFSRRISPQRINRYLDKKKFVPPGEVKPTGNEYRFANWVIRIETTGGKLRIASKGPADSQLVEQYSTPVEQDSSIYVEGVYHSSRLGRAAVLVSIESEGCKKGCRSFVKILDVTVAPPSTSKTR